MTQHNTYYTMLSIAGSDPSGGAGIQADIKTASALGVYSMTAITAITAQNTCGVRGFKAVGDEMLRAQLECIFDDIPPGAIKIGMLPNVRAVETVIEIVEAHPEIPVVCDPVLVATSGDALASADTLDAVRRLCRMATVATPNVPELEALSGIKITDVSTLKAAVEALDAKAVLVKCGHFGGADAGNILVTGKKVYYFPSPRIDTPNTHGTGCSLSSAIASFLSHGTKLPRACACATHWLNHAITEGAEYKIGHGHGPVNHLMNNRGFIGIYLNITPESKPRKDIENKNIWKNIII